MNTIDDREPEASSSEEPNHRYENFSAESTSRESSIEQWNLDKIEEVVIEDVV